VGAMRIINWVALQLFSAPSRTTDMVVRMHLNRGSMRILHLRNGLRRSRSCAASGPTFV